MAKLNDFRPQQKNANKHTQAGQGMLETSVQRDGWIDAQTAAADGEMISGSQRLTLAGEKFADVEPIIVESDGTRPVIVKRTDIPNTSDPRARRLSVAANQITAKDWNPDAAILAEWGRVDESVRQLFDPAEWDALLYEKDGEFLEPAEAKARRTFPPDVIYTMGGDGTWSCCSAVMGGMSYGIQSAKNWRAQLCPREKIEKHRCIFVDNDYSNYNHDIHLEAVRNIKPKYATVRDIMSTQQCADAGIGHFSLEKILDWAEELREFAENVVVIPKYEDAIDKIPDYFMLGYSVPSSHGRTPIPLKLFSHRRVHLLGGSWKTQLTMLYQLGDAAVSLDTNYIHRIAQYGQFVNIDGEVLKLSDLGINVTNMISVCVSLSCGMIMAKIKELVNDTPSED
jgi:hypothetical protein